MKCPECGTEMELSVEIDRDEMLVRRYVVCKYPKCGHIIHREVQ